MTGHDGRLHTDDAGVETTGESTDEGSLHFEWIEQWYGSNGERERERNEEVFESRKIVEEIGKKCGLEAVGGGRMGGRRR